MGFRRDELEAFRDRSVPDLVRDDVRLLFVGINPGLWTAATGAPFAHPGNRFYPALAAAGIIPAVPDFAVGLTDLERAELMDAGIGITNLVNRATVRADELDRSELRQGALDLERRVAEWQPLVVAIVGLTAYRQGFGRPRAAEGRQPESLAGAELWAVPNPSGLNAHATIPTLARAYAGPAQAAGLSVNISPQRE